LKIHTLSSSQLAPALRVAPVGELRAYTVSQEGPHELARGGNVSVSLDFGISLISIFATIAVTFLSVSLDGRVFLGFFSAGLVTLILGAFFLIKGLRDYRSTGELVKAIKSRLPFSPGVQESTNVVSSL
jgi:hypothetical protein